MIAAAISDEEIKADQQNSRYCIAKRAVGNTRSWAKTKKSQVEQKKLKDLFRYLDEYIGQYSIIVSKSLRGKQFVEYQAFLEKLNEAIKQQEQVVELINRELIQSKAEWANARIKKGSYKKLMEKTAAQELRELAKREQTEIDELSNRKDRGI